MTTLVDERKYTAEDLLTLPDADRYELRHGMLVERDMGTESNWLAARVLFLLGLFLETHPHGYLFNSETSYACFPNDPGLGAARPRVGAYRGRHDQRRRRASGFHVRGIGVLPLATAAGKQGVVTRTNSLSYSSTARSTFPRRVGNAAA